MTATGLFADGEIIRRRAAHPPVLCWRTAITSKAMRLLAKIGMKLEVYDDAEFLLEQGAAARAGLSRHALRLRAHAPRTAQARAGARADSTACSPSSPAIVPTESPTRPRASASAASSRRSSAIVRSSSETPRAADMHLSIAHALKTLGRQPEAVASLSHRLRAADPASAMRTGASPTSRPTGFRTRRSRGCARKSERPDTGGGGPLSPVLRPRQGARGPRRVRRIVPLLRARQCAQESRAALQYRAHRA